MTATDGSPRFTPPHRREFLGHVSDAITSFERKKFDRVKTDTIAKNGRYITRNNLSTVGKDLTLQDESGGSVTHNVKMPGRIAIPKVFGS